MGGLICFSTFFNFFLCLLKHAMSLEFLLKVSFGLWKFSWPSRSAYRSIDQFNWSRYKAGVVFPHQFPTKCIRVTVVRIIGHIAFAKNIRHQREMIEKKHSMQYKNDVIHS